jgi:hypothetical protein
MKTAMQELIDKLSNSIKFEYRNELVNLLKREKIDIKMAYNDGRKNALLKLNKNSEEYYNQTYNQK